MKVLFLHGWHSVPGGVKPTYLKDHDHEVINPALDPEDFDAAVRTAQAEFDQHNPDVVVGSSRGGAVAMNINSGDAKLVLLCPAWKNWGTVKTVRPDMVILHSRSDDVIPLDLSEGVHQTYVEDCPVCCRANTIHVEMDDEGNAKVWAEPEQDRE